MSESKFGLVTLAARRARNINAYFNQLGDGLGHMVPAAGVLGVAQAAQHRLRGDRRRQDPVDRGAHPEPAEDARRWTGTTTLDAAASTPPDPPPATQTPAPNDRRMTMSRWTFTSESVTEGHPDKMADQISDSVLDAILAEDPNGRVACETLLTTGLCVIAGEITTSAYVDIPKLARETIKSIGYDDALYGFDGGTCGVIVSIDEQSPEHRPGRDQVRGAARRAGRRGPDQRPGRRRPGDDVRLRVRRDPRPDAAADLDRPPPGRAPGGGAQVGPGARTCAPTARPR